MTNQVEVKAFELVTAIDISRELEWGGHKIRVIGTTEKPWFHGTDIATALGYAKPSQAITINVKEHNRTLGDNICRLLPGRSLNQYEKQAYFINESGLYSLIMKSKLKEAEAFQDWVTDVVLPSIRQTGGFQMNAEIQRLTSELSNQRLLTDNTERARKEAEEIAQAERERAEEERLRAEAAQKLAEDERLRAEEEQKRAEGERLRAEAAKKFADEESERARVAQLRAETEQKRADDTASENKELRNAINLGIENQEKWNKAMSSPPLDEKQYMYVATSTADMMDSTFKIGGVAEVGGLQGRLNSYNSSRKEADPYFFIWYGKCHDYRIVENVFWAICERYRDKQDTKKEIVRLRIEHVLDVLEHAIAGNRTIIDSYITKYSEFTRSTVIDGSPRMFPKLAVLGTSEKKSRPAKVEKIDAFKLAATDLRAIIVSAINNELRKTNPTYDFDTHSKTTPATFNWVDISHAFSDYADGAAWWRGEVLKVIKNSLVHLVQRKSKAATITTVVTTATTIVDESIENESDEVDDS